MVPEITKSASAGMGRQPSGATMATPRPPSAPAKASSGRPSGKRHHGGQGQGRGASHEDVHPQRLAAADRRRMMDADPPVDLVMEADFPVQHVLHCPRAERGTSPGSTEPGRAGRGPRCKPGAG